MIIADFHLHSSHSEDSDTPMEQQIEAGIKAGLKHMCFTEHMDKDFPGSTDDKKLFEVDTDVYYRHCMECRNKYEDRMDVGFGIEYGCQVHLREHNINYVNKYPFDFVIASQHLVDGIDVYYPEYFNGMSEREAYLKYFEATLESICLFDEYDIFGHIDYIVRYGPNKNREYFYKDYADVLDEILRQLIMRGKGIEINTGGFRKLGNDANPGREILKRYHELGGEIITVGSDAHRREDVAGDFDRAEDMLKGLGYTYYCIYKNRKPVFLSLI
ncbi:MAG: histidinol-phosphatase HisJ family protein [Lachnospiraceae bacterium]|nr:histidinol-phosphatase HisJ family protein [Lachnospiraceae bacterium]